MGQKHERFWCKDEQTAYIRWQAPQSLRLLIADKNPNDIVYAKVKRETKKNKQGEKEKYQFIIKHAIYKRGGLVKDR